jgi:hypothetical protein
MPQASEDYVALGASVDRHDCTLGLSVVGKQFNELVVRSRIGKRPVVGREPILANDHNSAATRLLSRLKRKDWK